MKKSFLLSLLFVVALSALKAQTVLDRVLLQGKAPFNSTTWIDTAETKYYYDSMGLMVRKTETDLRASTPDLFEVDTNSYDSVKRLKERKRYYSYRGSTAWNFWGTVTLSYSGALLASEEDKFLSYTHTTDYVYNTDNTIKEKTETQGGGTKFQTSFFYNSSKQKTKSIKVRKGSIQDENMEKDSFVYVGGKLTNDISYRWNGFLKNWDSAYTRTYTYNTDGTLKEKVVKYHEMGIAYENYRYLYFYKSLSTGIRNTTNNTFKIYPNPTSGKFTIELGDIETSTITITDITGKQVYTTKASGDLDIALSVLQFSLK
jgi:hypothetical protein